MPLTLIHGQFRIVGASPDGDSVRFYPTDPLVWDRARIRVRANAHGGVQLRLDAIDALETHYTPRTVTADRGYGEAAVDQALSDLGVRNVVIPRKGRPGTARQQVEHRRAFRRTVKWRTGREGRISTLKRGYGWDRTRLDDLEGAKTWTGQGDLHPQPDQDRRPDRLKTRSEEDQQPGDPEIRPAAEPSTEQSEFFRSK